MLWIIRHISMSGTYLPFPLPEIKGREQCPHEQQKIRFLAGSQSVRFTEKSGVSERFPRERSEDAENIV
jgi:hypothetical protein